jgi:hypothetical protein
MSCVVFKFATVLNRDGAILLALNLLFGSGEGLIGTCVALLRLQQAPIDLFMGSWICIPSIAKESVKEAAGDCHFSSWTRNSLFFV